MRTALFTHSACIEHDPGFGHPECADRLRAIDRALEGEEFQTLDRREAPRATVAQVALAHPASYVERMLAAVPDEGFRDVDVDTTLSPGSGEAALRAAGACVAAVDTVMAGDDSPEGARNAFCAVRPPGHHAEADRSMGFCVFNNAAVAARYARQEHGLQRVAVIDWDVHHGNGTQDIFWNDAALFYASVHQSPLYPGTGAAVESGARNNILNVPLRPGAGGADFYDAMVDRVFPAIDRFAPELIVISAGFDGHRLDPLAHLSLSEGDFVWATAEIGQLANKHAASRLISTLEGGYNLTALGASVAAHVRALMAL
jgi:acetoin utilization deacetylase AcuC-like enzyme